MNLNFESKRETLKKQYTLEHWLDGASESELCAEVEKLESTIASHALVKAKTFELIAEKSKIAIDVDDIFQDKLLGYDIMQNQRRRWDGEIKEKYFREDFARSKEAFELFGLYSSDSDYGHTSPNTRLMLKIGLSGLLERIENAASREGLSEEQTDFYISCKTVLLALMTLAKRLADAIEPYNEDNADALRAIAERKPGNIYEAMQLLVLYFFAHEYVGGTRVRTLGRLDALLYPFYKADIESGRFTKEEIREMLRFFLYKFYTANVPFGLPFCIGGLDVDESEVTNEISYLIVEVFDELNINSPKIHVRISDKTPVDFVKRVLSAIRGGNSSFVLVNDKIGIETLKRVGVEHIDALDYVPTGCYEPTVCGIEVGCTGNGGVNVAKVIELVLTGGCDFASGKICGLVPDKIESFDDFVNEVKRQIKYLTEICITNVRNIEGYYSYTNPDPILSCQYEESINRGVDVYSGGAKYNNSSMYFYCIASLIDSLCAVKKIVFDDKLHTLEELSEILKNNWQTAQATRRIALTQCEKYGNNTPLADTLAKDISDFCAGLVNNVPNGRGGVFKAALFSIDWCFRLGHRTMATPDGRLAGDELSKNLCASVGMDRRGITALINSVTKIDHASFPTGSVLDIVLHPSAVMGEDGLDAFYAIVATYFKKGGFALHGNVFDADDLIRAQKNPEKYENMQVRLCGWNTYFVNLSKEEQDSFIRQAKNAQ